MDKEFFSNLDQRTQLSDRLTKHRSDPNKYPLKLDDLKYRHGLSPAATNVRNIRHKRDPKVDTTKVHEVEKILKDLIEYGFADNCEEELLEFDEDGELANVTKGVQEKDKSKALGNSGMYLGDYS
eukprot:CAMPEP_0176373468 /NCGR_PEP_ID=MMETSP0126-20121128/26057_1 /TAXON_ID=141414 ORGANISM="Strombidinopsis acuminatum, Strain SPMC142" /NCGR_SAMPLE_ID=MMETSP0126 /ASSEMBLY_ACC=CAM_ASM_000229 /LENGTH=124 /DNA_ID=CAMNT_0017733613 /DNA_START=425 /DNA_END=799 /DNA_ORIENTATION=-